MTSPAALAVVIVAVLTVALPAHGGQYRGPSPPLWPGKPPPSSGGPMPTRPATTGGPRLPSPGAPTGPRAPMAAATGTPVLSSDSTQWETWWEFNKDPFLGVRVTLKQAPISGSDDFYLGARRPDPLVDVLALTDVDRSERIVPVLAGLLGSERQRDVATACLVALGKIGRDGPGVDLEKVLSEHIARDDQEVRETAVLALGIAGRAKALPMLTALLRDDAAGRRLADRSEVAERTRAFAAYGLGLLAMRNDDANQKLQVHDVLWAQLQDPAQTNREVRTAVVSALGILRCNVERGAQKRLQWQTVEELLGWFQRDLGRSEEIVQAQAPIAIMRLLGRGSSQLHTQCKAVFAAVLLAKERRGNALQQSAALALGGLSMAEEQHADDAACVQALRWHYEHGHDRQARYFALIALGRIGGAANRTWMLQAYERSNKATERPWVALALGLLAAKQAKADAADGQRVVGTDATIAQLLLDDLQQIQNQEVQGALAVGLGLTGHAPAAAAVMRMLRDHEGEERLAGYLCVALALLGEQGAVPMLSAILERSSRRPFLLQQSAVALGRLGDREATPRLLKQLAASESTAVLSAVALAIGQIGDRRSIEPLVAMAGDAELTKLARAFVVAALGSVGDKDELRWNLPLTIDCNYAAAVDTMTNGSTGILDIL